MLRFRIASSRDDNMRNAYSSLNTTNTTAATAAKTTATTNATKSNITTILANNRIYAKTLASAGITTNSNITKSFYPRTLLIAKNFKKQQKKTVLPQTQLSFPLVNNNNNSINSSYTSNNPINKSISRSTTPKVQARVNSMDSSRNTTPTIDCSCVFCLNKLISDKRQKSFGAKSANLSIVDTKSFIQSLRNLKTTIKVDTNVNDDDSSSYYSSNLLEPTVSTMNSNRTRVKTTGQTRVLSKTSRIKLWRPDEISNFENENSSVKSRQTVLPAKKSLTSLEFKVAISSSSVSSSSSSKSPESVNKNNLARVFQDLKLNPNLSPLLIQSKETGSKQVMETPTIDVREVAREKEAENNDNLWHFTNSDIVFEDKYPTNPPTTPTNPLFKVVITSRDKAF